MSLDYFMRRKAREKEGLVERKRGARRKKKRERDENEKGEREQKRRR